MALAFTAEFPSGVTRRWVPGTSHHAGAGLAGLCRHRSASGATRMLDSTSGQERDDAEFDAVHAAIGWRRTAATQICTPQVIQELQAI